MPAAELGTPRKGGATLNSSEIGRPNRSQQHPIVSTLISGRFQLVGKLIDVALEFHQRRKAEEKLRK